jgi:hypothetical protein
MELDTFTRHYIIAALWSTMDDYEEYFYNGCTIDDISEECLAIMKADCEKFQQDNKELLAQAYECYKAAGSAGYHYDNGTPEACAAHDFWLTRNRHGAGFWDRRELQYSAEDQSYISIGEMLTEASHKFREVEVFVGSDGKIYC